MRIYDFGFASSNGRLAIAIPMLNWTPQSSSTIQNLMAGNNSTPAAAGTVAGNHFWMQISHAGKNQFQVHSQGA